MTSDENINDYKITSESIYKEVFSYRNKEGLIVCQIFLRDGYTIDLSGVRIDQT